MAQVDSNGLFAIEVDVDDYAEAAAGDTPSAVDRTFQSVADFQKQKAAYKAKVDQGNLYEELLRAVPELEDDLTRERSNDGGGGGERVVLGKKDVQLLGYAVGEMYYDGKYEAILGLCGRVREVCEFEGVKGLKGSLERWEEKCRARIERAE